MSFENPPAPGSFVVCNFPEAQKALLPGRKPRPGLVMGYGREYNLASNVAVVAFCTTQSNRFRATRRFFLNAREAVRDMILPETGPYIDCANVRALPMLNKFFPQALNTIGYVDTVFFQQAKALIAERPKLPITTALVLYEKALVFDSSCERPAEDVHNRLQTVLDPDPH